MELQSIILDGWPEKRNEVPAEIRKYWALRDEMDVADGLVAKGDCVIIPNTLQRHILEKLHAAHQCIEKTRLRSRTCVYWSGIKCGNCQEMQHVRIRDHVTESWKPAIVKDVCADEPRSYNVVQPTGGILM